MNVELLQKVKQHILEEPRRLYMSWYEKDASGFADISRKPPCGTAACIAGWALLLSDMKPWEVDSPHEEAMALLGIDDDQARRLFEPCEWPDKFEAGLEDDGKASTATVCAARIDHFIDTKGRE